MSTRAAKGNLQSWRQILDNNLDPIWGCGNYSETGRHVALSCIEGKWLGRKWGAWGDMDDSKKWKKQVKDGEREYTVDLVEELFTKLDLR